MIHVAVIGYGYWGPNLVRNFQETEGACVAVCCDMNPQRLDRCTGQISCGRHDDEYDEVLAEPTIDAVAIATPVATHYEFARQALEHGKHVLVEKPLAASVAEAESLVEIAAKQHLTLMVNHTFIYTGAVRKMKEIWSQGDIRRSILLRFRAHQSGSCAA